MGNPKTEKENQSFLGFKNYSDLLFKHFFLMILTRYLLILV